MSEPDKPVGVIFDVAVELPSDRRAAFLNEVCAGDPALRQRVEALLRAHELAGTFMTSPAVRSKSEPAPVKPSEQLGEKIGHYKLLQQIGEGGCGVVYMAEQEQPVKRRVALKVIKLGMDTKSVIAPVRSRAPSPGADGSSEHCESLGRRRDGYGPSVFRHGTGAGHQDHGLL